MSGLNAFSVKAVQQWKITPISFKDQNTFSMKIEDCWMIICQYWASFTLAWVFQYVPSPYIKLMRFDSSVLSRPKLGLQLKISSWPTLVHFQLILLTFPSFKIKCVNLFTLKQESHPFGPLKMCFLCTVKPQTCLQTGQQPL